MDELLAGLERYARCPDYPAEFGARVYKIARDPQGARLTYLKVTGGTLKVKAASLRRPGGDDRWEEKADQLRIYSGQPDSRRWSEAPAGTVCAVTGLSRTCRRGGAGHGGRRRASRCWSRCSPIRCMPARGLRPPHRPAASCGSWRRRTPSSTWCGTSSLREIHIQLMGEVQLEILQPADRRALRPGGRPSAQGSIVYRETIAAPVEGVGHYEPLRHYAEVHLLLEPGERGSGLQLRHRLPARTCWTGNWQRLILTHLAEREHLGVLTGSPITDMKHHPGGRPGPREAHRGGRLPPGHLPGGAPGPDAGRRASCWSPGTTSAWSCPPSSVGRAMSDLQRHGRRGRRPRRPTGRHAVLTGAGAGGRPAGLRAGGGRLHPGPGTAVLHPGGLRAPATIRRRWWPPLGYDPRAGHWTTRPDSVFCAHGAGFVVKWDQVKATCPRGQRPAPGRGEPEPEEAAPRRARPARRLCRLPGAGQGAAGHLRADLRPGGARRPSAPSPSPPAPAWTSRQYAHPQPGPAGRNTCWWTATTSSSPGTS